MKKRKIASIEFFLEPCEAGDKFDVGFHKINGIWMRDGVKINGEEPDCPAVNIREFEKMLAAPGKYEPFTCTCGYMEDCEIHYPVRCFHKEDFIILIIRDPLQTIGPCDDCEFFADRIYSDKCPAEFYFPDCPFLEYKYRAHIFLKSDIADGLKKLRGMYES